MKKKTVTLALLIAAAFGAALLAHAAAGQPQEPVSTLGMACVQMGSDYISRDGRWLVAFVPSGSTDKRVLVSITGHWVPGDRVDYVAAAARVSDILGPGVQIWALVNSGGEFPDGTQLAVTIVQPGARFGEPRPVEQPLGLHSP